MPYITLLPVFAEDVWDVGSVGFGLMQAAGGIGGLVGALTVANLDAYSKKGRLLLGGAVGFGGFLILFALSPSFYLGLFFLGLVGYGAMVLMTVNNTAIQLIITDEVRGRVMSVMMMSFGLMPLGSVPAGIAAQALGDVRPVVATGGALCVVTLLVFFAVIPSLRSLDRRLEEEQTKAGPAPMDGHPAPGRPPVAAEPASARAD
jgi:MFS family permease